MSPQTLSFTILDAAKVTGLGRTTLYNLIASGKLEARKSGARTLIMAESLVAYIGSLERAHIGKGPRAQIAVPPRR